MAVNFTPQQQQVIDLKDCNILVSAAAGSGKTAVLVERIIRMICREEDPVDIDRLLIVTFTNAAAAEMRERISQGITRQLALHPESEHIQRQSALLHNAQITTIDSFCMFLLRNHFNEIGVDPAFRVMDEGEKCLMMQDVMAELLEDKFAEAQGSAEAQKRVEAQERIDAPESVEVQGGAKVSEGTKTQENEEAQENGAPQEETAGVQENEGMPGDFAACVEFFCPNGREQVLEDYIRELYEFAESCPWPEEWLLARMGDYTGRSVEEMVQTDYARYLDRHITRMLEGCLDQYRRIQALCQEPGGPYMYGAAIDKELEQVEKLLRLPAENRLQEYAARIPAFRFERLPAKKDDTVLAKMRDLAKSLRNKVKKTLGDLASDFFATPLPLAAIQEGLCAGPVRELVALAREFRERLQAKKREEKLVDFSDMEHFALEILLKKDGDRVEPSPVALEYRQHFREILIDEYQDSNLVQEYLLWAISGEEDGHFNRFMVGDVKQSIYKFRLARPELFLEKYEKYGEQGDLRRIDLSKNFRSRREVVDTVNDIFQAIMRREIGGIDYDERARLYAGASYPENPDCRSELLLVEKPGKKAEGTDTGREAEKTTERGTGKAAEQEASRTAEKAVGKEAERVAGEESIEGKATEEKTVEEKTKEEKAAEEKARRVLSAREAEAVAVAKRILELMKNFQVTDKETGKLRPVQFRDMVILLRATGGWDEDFKKILEEYDIPVYISSRTGYFAASEVQTLLNLLRVLDNPRQEIPLFGVMKSPFGGFSDEEIALIRSQGKGQCLIEELEQLAGVRQTGEQLSGEQPSRELQEKIRDFLYWIRRYREKSVYLPIRELLQEILQETGYLEYVSALPAGGKRRANVEMLLTRASDFRRTGYHSLFRFVRYIEQLEKYEVDYGEAELLDENADVVRIMSIHRSKGLEFPVTFVCGLGKRFNMQDSNQSMIVDMDLGIGTNFVDTKQRIRNKTLRRQVLSRKMKEDNLSEELRILYVALTRAKEKLIMTASLDKAREQWEVRQQIQELSGAWSSSQGQSLSYPEFIEGRSFLDFLLPVIGRTQVEVKILDPAAEGAEGAAGGDGYLRALERRQLLQNAEVYADPQALSCLRTRFAWCYPLESLKGLYTKTTVTELKLAAMEETDEAAFQLFEEKETVPCIPRFLQKDAAPDGATRGNAYHKAMQLLDFDRLYAGILKDPPAGKEGTDDWPMTDGRQMTEAIHAVTSARGKLYDNLEKLLAELAAAKRLSQSFRQILNLHKLVCFLESELALRMWRADRKGKLYREQPFVYGINADRLESTFPKEEKVLIQGIIDAYFEEEGGLVLVDYKTDLVHTPEELWNRYEVQLSYYQEALEHLLGRPVTQKILYSFSLEQCVTGES